MKWKIAPLDEQECVINVDYCNKKIVVYTNRKSVGVRLQKKLGKPTKIYTYQNEISAVEYTKNLFDKDVAKFFSKMLIIGSFKKQDLDEN